MEGLEWCVRRETDMFFAKVTIRSKKVTITFEKVTITPKKVTITSENITISRPQTFPVQKNPLSHKE
ncbi:hypothetical protein B4U37_02390 [Sutcliffiella horikoshii]|uniref:Uncharacterized protein n=1 Tax=Sutcliffiella horikoshii TaxID=79883 RepID=A0ABN4Z9D2_9BACI|nr:hypothetical protein B4U37_02390 [Sutcliffiella horikoshii]